MLLTATLAAGSVFALAQDSGALFKAKCAMCHGDEGQGKMKFPALKGTKKTEAEIVAMLTKGGAEKAPHTKPVSGLTAEQATGLAKFVKALK